MKNAGNGMVPWFVPYLGLVGLLAFHITFYPNQPVKDLYVKTTLWALFSVVAANFIWYALTTVTAWCNRLFKWLGERKKSKPRSGGYIEPLPAPKQTSVRQSTADPGQLVASWVAAKAVRKDGAKTNIVLVRSSFESFCRKEKVEPSTNAQWLPRRLRELGYRVETAPKVKGDRAVGNRYVFDLAIK